METFFSSSRAVVHGRPFSAPDRLTRGLFFSPVKTLSPLVFCSSGGGGRGGEEPTLSLSPKSTQQKLPGKKREENDARLKANTQQQHIPQKIVWGGRGRRKHEDKSLRSFQKKAWSWATCAKSFLLPPSLRPSAAAKKSSRREKTHLLNFFSWVMAGGGGSHPHGFFYLALYPTPPTSFVSLCPPPVSVLLGMVRGTILGEETFSVAKKARKIVTF